MLTKVRFLVFQLASGVGVISTFFPLGLTTRDFSKEEARAKIGKRAIWKVNAGNAGTIIINRGTVASAQMVIEANAFW